MEQIAVSRSNALQSSYSSIAVCTAFVYPILMLHFLVPHDEYPVTSGTTLSARVRSGLPSRRNSLDHLLTLSLYIPWLPDPIKPQALGTTFEARVRDYMAAHTKRMERFKNAIFKQREEINDKMTKIFRLLKELTTSRAPEKVLIREEAKFPVTKNVNSISLTKGEEERIKKTDVTTGDDIEKPTKTEMEMSVKEAGKEDEAEKEPSCELVTSVPTCSYLS
ncbi:hypothetical protein Tco_1142948 [Tanacetum coccineum]